MYKKYLIILIIDILILMNNSYTSAKYIFNYTLDVATINTEGNYYLITYTETKDSNEKVEKLYKGDNHDYNGLKLKKWIMDKRTTLKTIKIEDNSGDLQDCSYLFGGSEEIMVCHNITKIDLSKLNTENVTNMDFMFYDCIKLEELNISNLNTSKVIDMSYMFSNCCSLKTFDLRSFNTNNVIDMTSMFANCRLAKEIMVSNTFTFRNANTSKMFNNCGVSHVTLYN